MNRGYYMAARGYEYYVRVLKVSLTRSLRSLVRDTFSTRKHNLKLNCGCICGEESVNAKSYSVCELSLNKPMRK